jgi:membrane-associated phospholipid phosphatase
MRNYTEEKVLSTPPALFFQNVSSCLRNTVGVYWSPTRRRYTVQTTIILFFHSIATPFLDSIAEFFTFFGEETVFILIIAYILWCGSKRTGFAIYSTLLISLGTMSILKAIFRAPRPFQVLAEIEGKRLATATGYSFPSGHATGAASFYSSLAVSFKKRWLSIICAVLILMVAITRIYLGVHWPLDAFTGLVLGVTVTFIAYEALLRLYDNPTNLVKFAWVIGIIGTAGALALTFLISAGLADPVGFTDFLKLLSLAGGGYIGFAIDQSRIHYSVAGSTKAKIVRYVAGVVILLVIQGSKAILPEHLFFSFLRYIITGFWATGLYPLVGMRIKLGKNEFLFTRETT